MLVAHNAGSTPEQVLGNQVRDIRERLGWSQETLARRLREVSGIDLHQSAIARLERGERAIRFNEAIGLGQVLSIDMSRYGGPAGSFGTGWPDRAAVREAIVEEVADLREAEARATGRLVDAEQDMNVSAEAATMAMRRHEQAREVVASAHRELISIRERRERLEEALDNYEDHADGKA